ncbi:MAG: TonB-dependent receptor [Candidatus Margulisbacteria bacterium]|nr:TonB-dependent receptor [Candidatus Margulisiibacteriota bacterium]MBU1021053.1 TonB-dependent receptor [Candidatus Margulisiibacteriota bacterium]MBU1729728.1 TonB-dependent receptor [Candidatus Margulisiibacteriota bacterium]MBU1955993.1 TonB-dependent receptor [Candidatus Margulisiibacteriota bacterium]
MKKLIVICFVFLFALVSSASFAYQVPAFKGKGLIVTATRYLTPRISAPFSSTVIDADDIAAMGSRNLAEALQFTVGVDVKQMGSLGTTSTLRLRGSTYEEVLVLLNGRRANSPLLGGFAPEDVWLDNVERIEVVRFPVSSLYGADAVGGVINIITKKPQPGFSIETYFATYDTQKYLIAAGSDILDFSAGYLKSNGFLTNNDYTSQNYTGAFKLGMVDIDFGHYVGDKGVPGSTVFPTPNTRQVDRKSHINFAAGGLSAFHDEKLQLFNSNPGTDPNSIYNCWTDSVGWQQNLDILWNDLTYGAEWREDRGDSAAAGIHVVNNAGLFLADEISFGDWATVNLGLRGDSHSVVGSSINPRVGMVFELARDLNLRMGVGSAYRVPTLNELYWYYLDPSWGIVTRGNANLKPEQSNSLEIGLEHEIDPKTRTSISFYATETTDMIRWIDVSGTWMTWEAQNIAAAKAMGVEIEIARSFTDNFWGFLNYTYENAVDGTTGNHLTYSPLNKINAGLQYDSGKGCGLGLFARHVGERYDDINNTRTVPCYTVADLNLWKKIADWTINFGINNLGNEVYQDTLNYPMPGRTYTIGVKLIK